MIGFSLNKTYFNGKWAAPVVIFDSKKWDESAIAIKGPDDMPETFHEGLHWRDLNIMEEAFIDGLRFASIWGARIWPGRKGYCHDDGGVENLERLYYFVHAFDNSHGPMWMTVWEDTLDQQLNTLAQSRIAGV